mmetsp:Transcript_24682/g.80721  ORF Transcript_24682/g.80721 Transcript_24682/m.80721 type:complete len:298 (+) Transcript_24682:272-1165(+)
MHVIDLYSRLGALLRQPPAEWGLRAMQQALQLAGKDLRNYNEKGELRRAVQELLAPLPRAMDADARVPIPRHSAPEPVDAAAAAAVAAAAAHIPAQKSGGEGEGEVVSAAPEPAPAPAKPQPSRKAPAPAPKAATAATAAAEEESDDSDGPEDPAETQKRADAAKKKGNDLFSAGEYNKAATAYSMAIRLDRGNHVLFSNRSAAYAGAGEWEKSLADAERCVRLQPKWAKGYGRKGAALVGSGQAGEGVKAYLAGLQLEPENEFLKEGLKDAKQSIRDHQKRYEEMWGKPAPGAENA